MPIIDQNEIDALLSEADGLAAETPEQPTASTAATAVAKPRLQVKDPQLRRLLRLQVPVTVRLARQPMSISVVRNLSVGAILEFDKAVEDELDLLIGDRLIGNGQCVKVGENFGLRISNIVDRHTRVRSLGPEDEEA